MIKKVSLFTIFLLTMVVLTPVSKAAADPKVGMVNLQMALNQVNEGKKAKASIQSEMNIKKKELEVMKEQLKKMRDDIEAQKMVLSKEALQQKMTEIQTKFVDLQKKAVEFETVLKQKEAESINRILTSLRKTAVTLAKEKQYDIVYENSLETVLYSSTAEDFTGELIKAYNRGVR